MDNTRLLQHIVFWPGILSEVLAQIITVPSVWFILTLPGFFHSGSLERISESVGLGLFLLAFGMWFLACGKLLTIFGYFFDRRGLMQTYSVLQLLYLAVGMRMMGSMGIASSHWFVAIALLWFSHLLLAIYVAFRKSIP